MRKLVTWTLCASLAVVVGAVSFGRARSANAEDKAAKKTIPAVAIEAGSFKTLVKALTEADLVKTLEGDGPFTVFAPTDEAFEKLPKGALESLLKDKEKLKAVLLYHVVSGKHVAKDVAGMTEAKTVQGAAVKFDTKDGVKVNGAKVVKADVEASNGVIHVIDTVLMPPTK